MQYSITHYLSTRAVQFSVYTLRSIHLITFTYSYYIPGMRSLFYESVLSFQAPHDRGAQFSQSVFDYVLNRFGTSALHLLVG